MVSDEEIEELADYVLTHFRGHRKAKSIYQALLALKAERAKLLKKTLEVLDGFYTDTKAALSTARAEALEEAIQAARRVGNYVGLERHELTDNFGQPRFDMMNDIIRAIEALKDKTP